jgi:hypothetical protein
LLIIGGVVASFAVFNSVYPAVERSSQAVSDAADIVNDRMTSKIEIIQVGGTLETVSAWVKNVGSSRIGGVEGSDVFFGKDGSMTRVAFGDNTTAAPRWSYQLEGGNTQWSQAVTNRFTIYLAEAPDPGIYLLKVVLPNGIFDENAFTLE